MWHLNQRQATS